MNIFSHHYAILLAVMSSVLSCILYLIRTQGIAIPLLSLLVLVTVSIRKRRRGAVVLLWLLGLLFGGALVFQSVIRLLLGGEPRGHYFDFWTNACLIMSFSSIGMALIKEINDNADQVECKALTRATWKQRARRGIILICGLVFTVCGYYIINMSSRYMSNRDSNAAGKTTILLGLDEVLFIRSDKGEAWLDFTELGNARGTYQWTYYDRESLAETSGGGVVVERYEAYKIGPVDFLRDQGSQVNIEAGGITCEWSYCSNTSGWVIIYGNIQTSKVLSKRSRETRGAVPLIGMDKGK